MRYTVRPILFSRIFAAFLALGLSLPSPAGAGLAPAALRQKSIREAKPAVLSGLEEKLIGTHSPVGLSTASGLEEDTDRFFEHMALMGLEHDDEIAQALNRAGYTHEGMGRLRSGGLKWKTVLNWRSRSVPENAMRLLGKIYQERAAGYFFQQMALLGYETDAVIAKALIIQGIDAEDVRQWREGEVILPLEALRSLRMIYEAQAADYFFRLMELMGYRTDAAVADALCGVKYEAQRKRGLQTPGVTGSGVYAWRKKERPLPRQALVSLRKVYEEQAAEYFFRQMALLGLGSNDGAAQALNEAGMKEVTDSMVGEWRGGVPRLPLEALECLTEIYEARAVGYFFAEMAARGYASDLKISRVMNVTRMTVNNWRNRVHALSPDALELLPAVRPAVTTAGLEEVGTLTNAQGEMIVLTRIPASTPGRHPAAVVGHGYGGHGNESVVRAVAEMLNRLGFHVYIPQFRNSRTVVNHENQSTGTTETFTVQGMVDDLVVVLQHIQEDPNIDPGQKVEIVGYSMSGFAVRRLRARGDPRLNGMRLRSTELSGMIDPEVSLRAYLARRLDPRHPLFIRELLAVVDADRRLALDQRVDRTMRLWKRYKVFAGMNYWLDELQGEDLLRDLRTIEGDHTYIVGADDDMILGRGPSRSPLVEGFLAAVQTHPGMKFRIHPGLTHRYDEPALTQVIQELNQDLLAAGLEELPEGIRRILDGAQIRNLNAPARQLLMEKVMLAATDQFAGGDSRWREIASVFGRLLRRKGIDRTTRRHAAHYLGVIQHPAALGPLARALGVPDNTRWDPSEGVRKEALTALMQLNYQTPEELDRVQRLLGHVEQRDHTPYVRRYAAKLKERFESRWRVVKSLWTAQTVVERAGALRVLETLFRAGGAENILRMSDERYAAVLRTAMARETDPSQCIRTLKAMVAVFDELGLEREPEQRFLHDWLIGIQAKFPSERRFRISVARSLTRLNQAAMSAGLEESKEWKVDLDPEVLSRLPSVLRDVLTYHLIPTFFPSSVSTESFPVESAGDIAYVGSAEAAANLWEELLPLLWHKGLPTAVRWINAHLLLPHGVALIAGSNISEITQKDVLIGPLSVWFVPVVDYELYNVPGDPVPVPLAYLPAGTLKRSYGMESFGTAYLNLRADVGRMKRAREEELGHAWDDALWSFIPLDLEEVFTRTRLKPAAPLRAFLTRVSRASPEFALGIVLEYRALLRGLRGPHAKMRRGDMAYFPSGLPADWLIGHAVSSNLGTHELADLYAQIQFQEFGVNPKWSRKAAKYVPALWSAEWETEVDPIRLRLQRITPASKEEAQAQWGRLIQLARAPLNSPNPTAGLEESRGWNVELDPDVLNRLHPVLQDLLKYHLIPALFAENGDGAVPVLGAAEQLSWGSSSEAATNLWEELMPLFSKEGSLVWEAIRWVNARLLLPTGVVLIAGSDFSQITPEKVSMGPPSVQLVSAVGYELYRISGAPSLLPLACLPDGTLEDTDGVEALGTACLNIKPSIFRMKRAREEELGHAWDDMRWGFDPTDLEDLFTGIRLKPQAPLRAFLTQVSRGSTEFAAGIVTEYRALLRGLRGPYAGLYRETMTDIPGDRTADRMVENAVKSNEGIHELADLYAQIRFRGLEIHLGSSPDTAERVPDLWALEWDPAADPVIPELERIHPVSDQEAQAQWEKLGRLARTHPARPHPAAGLEEVSESDVLAQMTEAVGRTPGMLVVGQGAAKERPAVMELMRRSPELSERIIFFDGNREGLVAELLSMDARADQVGVLGDFELAGYLEQILPKSMEVTPYLMDTAFRYILAALGVPEDVLEKMNTEELEGELTPQRAA